jgi:hypothetical protein
MLLVVGEQKVEAEKRKEAGHYSGLIHTRFSVGALLPTTTA